MENCNYITKYGLKCRNIKENDSDCCSRHKTMKENENNIKKEEILSLIKCPIIINSGVNLGKKCNKKVNLNFICCDEHFEDDNSPTAKSIKFIRNKKRDDEIAIKIKEKLKLEHEERKKNILSLNPRILKKNELIASNNCLFSSCIDDYEDDNLDKYCKKRRVKGFIYCSNHRNSLNEDLSILSCCKFDRKPKCIYSCKGDFCSKHKQKIVKKETKKLEEEKNKRDLQRKIGGDDYSSEIYNEEDLDILEECEQIKDNSSRSSKISVNN